MIEAAIAPPHQDRLDLERRAFLDLLQMTNTLAKPEDLAHQLVVLARHLSGCQAVAVRLRSGPGFPYAASLGLSDRFVALEGDLCAYDEAGHLLRDEQRAPLLPCLCGRVLSGRTNPRLPCFTPRGSLVTPSLSWLLAQSGPELIGCTHLRCHEVGFETVALFPIRRERVTYGLIQCNDPRPHHLEAETVDLLENLAATAGHLFQLTMA